MTQIEWAQWWATGAAWAQAILSAGAILISVKIARDADRRAAAAEKAAEEREKMAAASAEERARKNEERLLEGALRERRTMILRVVRLCRSIPVSLRQRAETSERQGRAMIIDSGNRVWREAKEAATTARDQTDDENLMEIFSSLVQRLNSPNPPVLGTEVGQDWRNHAQAISGLLESLERIAGRN